MTSRLVACCILLCAAAARAQQPAGGGVVSLRFDAGMLNPDSPTRADLAAGASVGWSPGATNTFFARYLRQSANRDAGFYVFGHARQFLLLQWEHAFGSGELYQRQFSSGLGALSSRDWSAAVVLSGGVVLRYPVGRRLALIAGVDDNVALLPHRSCFNDGSGGTVCVTPPVGGSQHNFGLVASLEWWPRITPFRAAAPAPGPEPLLAPAEPAAGVVCGRLDASTGKLVRVTTHTRGPTGLLVVKRGSEVGPLVRCADGAIILGPTMGQESPLLIVPEASVTRAWARGDQRLLGTLIGTGAGAMLGYVVGSAK